MPLAPGVYDVVPSANWFLYAAVAAAVVGLLIGAVTASYHGTAAEKARKTVGIALLVGGAISAWVWSTVPERHIAWNLDENAAFAKAKAEGIRLIVITSPSHVRSLELLRAAGLWPELERFKRELAAITTRAGFELWEFGIPDAATTAEEVPPPGDATSRMRWYWESSHFTSALGDLALARVLAPPQAAGWGEKVTEATVDETLRKVSGGLETWGRAHPDDVEEIRKVVEEARAAQVCRRRQP